MIDGRPYRSWAVVWLVILSIVSSTRVGALQQQVFNAPRGVVENLRFEQAGGGTINITYDLLSPDDPKATFSIVMEVTQGTVSLKPTSLSGDLSNVAAGRGKRIVWQAGNDVEVVQINQFKFDIRAIAGRAATPPGGIAMGTLSITSTPAGATVLIDGDPRGQTPLTVSVPVGSHQVTLRRDGFQENARQVNVGPGTKQEVSVQLSPGTTPPPAKQGGGVNPLVWVAVAGGGAAAAGVALAGKGGGGGGGDGGGGTVVPPPPPTCTFSLSTTSVTFPAGGGSSPVNITAGAGCSWTATANASWVTLSPASGSGTGSVTLNAGANIEQATRTGTATVAGTTVNLSQPTNCTYSVNFFGGGASGTTTEVPGDGTGAGRVVRVVPSQAACTWTLQSANVPWFVVQTPVGTYTGTRDVNLITTERNPTGAFREGSFIVAGQRVTVRQCSGRC